MIYNAILNETREFVYAFTASDGADAMNKFITLDPKNPVPDYASILQGPIQFDAGVSNLCDAARGDYYQFKGQLTLVQGTPVFTNPFSSSYTATMRECRFISYWIDCNPSELNGLVIQLNPSIDTLPAGVTVAIPMQQSTIRPVTLYDPKGVYVSWWV